MQSIDFMIEEKLHHESQWLVWCNFYFESEEKIVVWKMLVTNESEENIVG